MSKPTRGKINRGVVSIIGETNLKPGDQVVVVQPLKVPILSSRTGRILGMDEKVLGRGTVVRTEDALEVQLAKVGLLKGHLDIQPIVGKGLKLHGAKGSRAGEVLIKLINTRMK